MTSPDIPISLRPLLRPGMAVSIYRGYTGTIGGFAVTQKGDIVFIFSEHLLGDAQFGDPILLEPYGIKVATVSRARTRIKRLVGMKGKSKPRCFRLPHAGETHNINMRFRGLAEDLPVVLKVPVIPELGCRCVKSGSAKMAKMVTYGKIEHLDWSLPVKLPDGTYAHFRDQIATEPMAKDGDSGAILFTADTFDPVGLLASGNEFSTFFSKLTGVSKESSLAGIYSPISLPKETPLELKYVISKIIPDGFFAQKSNLFQVDPQNVLAELGVREIHRRHDGSFSVLFNDMIVTTSPHLPGDEGSLITSDKGELIGLVVAGSENTTIAIKASRIIKALNLELVRLSDDGWKMLHYAGYAKKFCDTCNVSLYLDTVQCPFCGRRVYWGSERIKHYIDEKKRDTKGH